MIMGMKKKNGHAKGISNALILLNHILTTKQMAVMDLAAHADCINMNTSYISRVTTKCLVRTVTDKTATVNSI